MGHFLPFYPTKIKKIKILKKWKNPSRYQHFTYVYQKHNQMMYRSSETDWDRHKPFLPIYPLMIAKMKLSLKIKQCLEVLSFSTWVPKMRIIWCIISEKCIITDRVFCHFGLFYPFTLLNNPKNQTSDKIKKIPGDIIFLHMCTTDDNYMMYVIYMEHILIYGTWWT